MSVSPASQMRHLHDLYWTLVDQAATTGKFTRIELHKVIVDRFPKYRHARLEGFEPEEAFKIAGQG